LPCDCLYCIAVAHPSAALVFCFIVFRFFVANQHRRPPRSCTPPLSPLLISRSPPNILSPPTRISDTSLLVMSLPNGQLRRRPSSLERPSSRSGEGARPHRRSSSLEKRDPFSSPDIYYGDEEAFRKQFLGWSGRAVSSVSRLFSATQSLRHTLTFSDCQSLNQSRIHFLERQYSCAQTEPR
jgi:hypothetical protein